MANNNLRRGHFPQDFVFGTASSAFQYEGAADSRGENIWDTFCRQPNKIADGSDAKVAIDHYNRYKEDVSLMHRMGVDAYRFSISWARILPNGRIGGPCGGINCKGVSFYNNLINELLKHGIKPYVTLFHWDVPECLEQEYGGFLSRRIVDDFRDYANLCFILFGDRVKHWITLNEPWTFSCFGYATGLGAPGHCSSRKEDLIDSFQMPRFSGWEVLNNWKEDICIDPRLLPQKRVEGLICRIGDASTEPYLSTHYQILAHAAAVHLYRTNYQACQRGQIGVTLVTRWYEPYSDKQEDREAAQRAQDFNFGWFMDPLTTGYYPQSMRERVGSRLPTFTAEEFRMVKGSFDFLGLNYYTGNYAANRHFVAGRPNYLTDAGVLIKDDRDGNIIGREVGSGWIHIYPEGLHRLLNYIKTKYHNPIIYITENGMDEKENGSEPKPQNEALNDQDRIDYYYKHLYYLAVAIRDGVKVKGYFAWSFLDNFEWVHGYTSRYGIVYVDYKNGLKRIPKQSYRWFHQLLQK